MVESGKVTGREIKKNKDGLKSVILLQVQITDPDDVQTVELMNQSGEDNNPPDGSRVTIIDIGKAFKLAIASDDDIVPISDPGEKRTYSTDSDNSVVKASVHLKNDGTVEIENDLTTTILNPDGSQKMSNSSGFIELKSNGDVDINGFIIKANGDSSSPTSISAPSVVAAGKELAGHDHPILSGSSAPGPTGPNN